MQMQMKGPFNEIFAQGGVGRHETFTPRYGWLKKGYDAIKANPKIFKQDDAIVKLGVGKNMVKAMRSWCLAFKLINQEGQKISPNDLGKKLLDDKKGWDIYLEDDASLWLLHWQLFIPPFEMVSWSLAFNYCNLTSFDGAELAKIIHDAGKSFPRLARISPNTYRRDASCIIRMYVDMEKKDVEIESPFAQLGLLYRVEDKKRVGFNKGFKYTLPPLIFAATCFSYVMYYFIEGQRTVSLRQLVFGINSPGVAFKLSETDVGYYLNQASKKISGFHLVDVLGNMQLHLEERPEKLYLEALNKFYLER